MTLNINISIDQNQLYGLKVTSQGGPASNVEAKLQPGECVNVTVWECKDLLLEEIPKTKVIGDSS